MRISFVVYGVLYVLVDLIGARLEEIGWPQLTAFDVVSAVVHALVTVSSSYGTILTADADRHPAGTVRTGAAPCGFASTTAMSRPRMV